MAVPNHDIREVIGQGGMATVYRAEHVLLKQERALKLMSAELSREPGFQESFLREGQTVAGLQHPNIVTIHDIGQCGDGYFMSMEYLRGGSLQARLKAGPLPLQEALTVLRQVGGALAHAHERGLIHRDIKPANILFRANGEAVLTDFGISKLQDTDSDLTRHGYAMLGTPRYMSPEQTGAQRLDRRSDIYSLALVFYEMLAGKTAIRADTVAQIIREHALAPPPVLPEHYACLQAVLDKALAKQPEERYSNVAAFLQAVEQSLAAGAEDQTVILPPPQATEPPAKRGRRPALYLLPLLLLPTGAGWWYWAGGKAEQAPSAVTPPVVPAASIPAKEVEAHTPPPPVPPEPAAPQELAAVPVQP
ncbi:serine/threonine-protein kinase, partial [Candidatus Thiothrix sp. Deng01]